MYYEMNCKRSYEKISKFLNTSNYEQTNADNDRPITRKTVQQESLTSTYTKFN